MLYELVHNFPDEILFDTEGPFISLYQPTFKVGPDNKQDIIRFKNLTKEKFCRSVVLYTGNTVIQFGENLWAVRIQALWE